MLTVKEILKAKGHEVWAIAPQAKVFEALQVMAEKDVGALLVVESDRLVGIFSERDYARKVVLEGKSSKETPVNEIMSHKVFYVQPEQTVEDCMALMTNKHIRHLPVLENGRLMGIISIGDVVKAIISEQEFVIAQLEKYIGGSGYGY
ncbi:MAG: CBS domain-containing protein [Chloroflexota bacterium]|nr:MAG: CBS domain-containing protein [Chloroflexota bacterium]